MSYSAYRFQDYAVSLEDVQNAENQRWNTTYVFAHLNKFAAKATGLGCLDRALWNLFREYFSGWLAKNFQLAGTTDLEIFRMFLRQRGVYVSTDPVLTTAQSLSNLLWAREPQAWPPEASTYGEMHFQYSPPRQPVYYSELVAPPSPQPIYTGSRHFPELVAPLPSRQPVYPPELVASPQPRYQSPPLAIPPPQPSYFQELVAPPPPQPRYFPELEAPLPAPSQTARPSPPVIPLLLPSAIPPPQTLQTRREPLPPSQATRPLPLATPLPPPPTALPVLPPPTPRVSPVLPPPKQSAPPKRPLHQPSSYRPPKPQTCIKCRTLFPSGTALHKHLPLCEPFECTKCHTTFRSKNTLHRHLRQRFVCRQKRLEKEISPEGLLEKGELPDDLMAIQVQRDQRGGDTRMKIQESGWSVQKRKEMLLEEFFRTFLGLFLGTN